MKVTIETEDKKEAMRLMYANDMAILIQHLKSNFWRKWKHDDREPRVDEVLTALNLELSVIPNEILPE